MSKTTMGFIMAGMVYLVIGVTLGALFFIIPQTRLLRTVHAHLNLVGFVMFLIFGVAYHILPRFRGRPLYSEGLAWVQFLLANVGLIGMLLLMGIGAYQPLGEFTVLLAIFGAILTISIYLFVYNMWRTLA
ncbi:MAG: cbb3-type cytochrome c oxidase subunit I [Chloroflexi bacterium]|nr:cbb3-type cytochrome c oxidase subunit I [Chloroflexota bacterium]MCL5074129.1 cbb3-type cytochrome c oxidase subunit I [Chloroflexota bacterium]